MKVTLTDILQGKVYQDKDGFLFFYEDGYCYQAKRTHDTVILPGWFAETLLHFVNSKELKEIIQ